MQYETIDVSRSGIQYSIIYLLIAFQKRRLCFWRRKRQYRTQRIIGDSGAMSSALDTYLQRPLCVHLTDSTDLTDSKHPSAGSTIAQGAIRSSHFPGVAWSFLKIF